MTQIKKNRKCILIVSGIFLFYLFMAYNLPLSGDDWTWASYVGMDRLKSFYANYNGRYLSNTIEVVLVRSHLFRVLFMAVVNTLLVYLTAKLISNQKKTSIFVLIAAFFTFMVGYSY